MTPKALIFDVDGTLAETEEVHRRAFNETFAEAGLDWRWSPADYRRLLSTTGGKERMRRHRDEIGAEEPSDREILVMHGRKTERYGEILRRGEVNLRPGVGELIVRARDAGLQVAVATTTSAPNVEMLCRACWGRRALDIFDVIAAGDEVTRKKPAPDVYLLALQRLGLAAADAIAFEDSANGVRAAKAAGLAVVATPSDYTAGEDLSAADWLLRDLSPGHLPDALQLAMEANEPRMPAKPGADAEENHGAVDVGRSAARRESSTRQRRGKATS